MAMSIKAADKEAKRRWGVHASVQWLPNSKYKAVGIIVMDMMFSVKGSSHTTWEDAFTNADTKFSPKEAK